MNQCLYLEITEALTFLQHSNLHRFSVRQHHNSERNRYFCVLFSQTERKWYSVHHHQLSWKCGHRYFDLFKAKHCPHIYNFEYIWARESAFSINVICIHNNIKKFILRKRGTSTYLLGFFKTKIVKIMTRHI